MMAAEEHGLLSWFSTHAWHEPHGTHPILRQV